MTNLVKLDSAVLADIPNVLRSIADELEAGEYGQITAGVVVLQEQSNALNLFGLGAADQHRAVAILAGATQTMVQKTMGVAVKD